MRRTIRLLLAVLWFAWTAIIIPGHTRGAIPVAGSSCCNHERPSDDSGKPTPNRNPSNCAVCQLAAHLMPAIVVPVQLDPVDLVEILPQQIGHIPNLRELPSRLQCRGPPTR